MPRNNRSTTAAETAAAFEHDFIARVNKEGDHREVMLRSADGKSPLSFVMRNQPGTAAIVDGAPYRMTLTEIVPETDEHETADAAQTPDAE